MQIRRAATPRGREAHGFFSIEGTRLHERALRAGVAVSTSVVADSALREPTPRLRELLLALEQSGTRLISAPDSEVEALTEGRKIGAMLGLVRLFEPPRLEQLIDRAERPLLLVGVDVEDPGNVGALVRTALASGASAFISVGLGDVYHPRAVRTSMGSLFKLPALSYGDVETLFRDLAAASVRSVAAVSSDGVPLPRAGLTGDRIALIVGSEAHGLPPAVEQAVDLRVTIPMARQVDSFSVNAAAAVVLYEVRRGRG